jgi:hypothetical protein
LKECSTVSVGSAEALPHGVKTSAPQSAASPAHEAFFLVRSVK